MNRFEEIFPNHPKGGYLYLASVFRKHVDSKTSAYLEASSATAKLLRAGVKVWSPIASFFPIAMLNGLDQTDHDFWMGLDIEFLRHARGLVVLQQPGWKLSEGIRAERDFAEANNMPEFSLDWPVRKLGNAD